MSDAPFMIGANGLIVDTSLNGFAPGYATVGQQPNIAPGETPNFGNAPTPGPWVVTQLLPGALIQLRGGGQFPLPTGTQSPMLAIGNGSNAQLAGITGSMQVDVVTGAAGTQQGLAFEVSADGTAYVGIWLDTSNRPSFTIAPVSGTTVAVGAPTGSAIPSGTVLQIRLFWDATGKTIPGFVAFYVNGVAQPLGAVTGPWSNLLFQPASIEYGRGAVFGSFVAFAGTFLKFQAGNSPVPTTSPIQPAVSQTPL